MLISDDNHAFPIWAPDWLRAQVESPDCSQGTHPCLRQLAKWLTIYFPEQPGGAERWPRHAAALCDRSVSDGGIDRLLGWAECMLGQEHEHAERTHAHPSRSRPDLDEIYNIAVSGLSLEQFRASSPRRLYDSPKRQTITVLQDWARYCNEADPLICFGADDRFWTRPFNAVKNLLHIHAQIVPSPMRAQYGMAQGGYPSEHTKDGTGERAFAVLEFDFAKTTPKGKPTIWAPLLEQCEAEGITALDIQASILAQLAIERPLWMTVFSGGKSLQGWFPCRGEDEEKLHVWFNTSALRLGACPSTWCVSQFVRMPDGSRAPNREGKSVRQSIEFYNKDVL
jgi:hypothetical protein